MRNNFLATTPGVIIVGALIGVLAIFLQKMGNPGNMGICVACFERDLSGGLGLHRAAIVQYLRPEIVGLVFGAFAAAIATGEFRPRGGSSPIIRFVLGIIAAMGALVFLGCPWRAILRLAGGDANAILGIAGLGVGIFIGTLFFQCFQTEIPNTARTLRRTFQEGCISLIRGKILVNEISHIDFLAPYAVNKMIFQIHK